MKQEVDVLKNKIRLNSFVEKKNWDKQVKQIIDLDAAKEKLRNLINSKDCYAGLYFTRSRP